MLAREPAAPALPADGRDERSAEPLRIPRRPGVPDQERGRGRGAGRDRRGLRGAGTRAAGRRGAAIRIGAPAARRPIPALAVPDQATGAHDPGRVPPGPGRSTGPSATDRPSWRRDVRISTTSTSSSSCSTKGPVADGAWWTGPRTRCATRGPRWRTGCPRPARSRWWMTTSSVPASSCSPRSRPSSSSSKTRSPHACWARPRPSASSVVCSTTARTRPGAGGCPRTRSSMRRWPTRRWSATAASCAWTTTTSRC